MSERPKFSEEDIANDKRRWGPGPWQDEPDCAWFDAHGFFCLVRRSWPGSWCGYVGVPEGHSWYNDQPRAEGEAQIHRGLSYGSFRRPTDEEGQTDTRFWLGFAFDGPGSHLPVVAAVIHEVKQLDPDNRELQASSTFEYPYDHAAAIERRAVLTRRGSAEGSLQDLLANYWPVYVTMKEAMAETAELAQQAALVAKGLPIPDRRGVEIDMLKAFVDAGRKKEP